MSSDFIRGGATHFPAPLTVAPNYLNVQKVDPDGEHKTGGKHGSNEFSVWKGGISHMFSQIRGDSLKPEW